jgi:fumarate hydratase class I
MENFIEVEQIPRSEVELHNKLLKELRGGAIYHCGPVVGKGNGKWKFLAAGPTTSIREEPYQSQVIKHFGLKAVIGKGGMGEKTLASCKENKAVYLHAVGGAASLIAYSVKEVLDVYKIEFGIPEAIWMYTKLSLEYQKLSGRYALKIFKQL